MAGSWDSNAVLRAMDQVARDSLGLLPVELCIGQTIRDTGVPEVHAYFPVTSVLSLVSTMSTGATTEVALVGREGMIGLSGVLGGSDPPTSAIVQIGGVAFQTTIAAVRRARFQNDSARLALDTYLQARLIQDAQTAACHRLHSIDRRLARWLLAIDDRVDAPSITVSQQNIADRLGVHRPTITTALQHLEQSGAIAHRGRAIVIEDRRRLESLACECHGVMHREFKQLIGGDREPIPHSGSHHESTHDRAEGQAAAEAMREMAGRLLIASLREREAREQAEAANDTKDRFLAMASHELRAPLQAILGWCTILKLRSQSIDTGLEVIERNAHVQLTLLNELLDSARMTADTLRIAPRVVDLAGVIESAIDTVRPDAEAKHVALRINAMGELSSIYADGDRLRQVLVNVLMNSVKFTNSGGYVEAEASTDNQRVTVTVRDSGRGISAEVLPHVFERFRQGDQSDSGDSGLGLGLSIARALIELHGGTIDMTSAGEGQGATCTIQLPRTLSFTGRPVS